MHIRGLLILSEVAKILQCPGVNLNPTFALAKAQLAFLYNR